MQTIAERFTTIHERIRKTELENNRPAGSVRLLAVTKKKPVADIRAAFESGQSDFGENYLQDALPKIEALSPLPLCWHFIGRLQANKTRPVAGYFDWVHSLDRLRIAQRLSDQRPPNLKPLNVCIQVNLDNEDSKAGVPPEAVAELALAVQALPNLQLRGLTALPRPETDPQKQRQAFRHLRELLETLAAEGLPLDTLSMGTSSDFEAAIAEGATIVRIGTTLFGPR